MRRIVGLILTAILLMTCSGCFWGWGYDRGYDDRDRGGRGEQDRGGHGEQDRGGHDHEGRY